MSHWFNFHFLCYCKVSDCIISGINIYYYKEMEKFLKLFNVEFE